MITLAAFVGSLPPASLAKADLPRFLVRALGRRSPEMLPPLIDLLDGATLVGYPAVMAPILRAFVERLVAEGRDPEVLDPDIADHILGTPAFLRLVASKVELEQMLKQHADYGTREITLERFASLFSSPQAFSAASWLVLSSSLAFVIKKNTTTSMHSIGFPICMNKIVCSYLCHSIWRPRS